MRRRSEVVVRPYRKGDRSFPKGVHRHVSLVSSDAATELIERPIERPINRPLRLVRRPPPLPRPRVVVVRSAPPSRTLQWSILGLVFAAAMLVTTFLA